MELASKKQFNGMIQYKILNICLTAIDYSTLNQAISFPLPPYNSHQSGVNFFIKNCFILNKSNSLCKSAGCYRFLEDKKKKKETKKKNFS